MKSMKSVIKPGQIGIPSGVVSNVMPSQPFGNHAFILVLVTASGRGKQNYKSNSWKP